MKTVTTIALSLSTACLWVPQTFAADNCSGYFVDVSQSSEVVDLGNGNTLAVFKSTNINISDDKTSPIHMTSGDCAGTALTTGGKTSASGRCSRKDTDGETYNFEWSFPAGAEKGTWHFVGGTGKWVNAKWSGWYQPTMASGKASGGIWGGNCK